MRPTDALPHPKDWNVKTVREAAEIRRGLSWSKDQECEYPREDAVPVLRIGNVQDHLDLSEILYVSGVPEKARTSKKAGKGWSIIVGSNGNRNRIGNVVFQIQATDFLFASFLIAAKPYEDSGILPEYFYRWLSSYEIQARLSASSEGTTGLSNLSHNFFKAMEISFPFKDEQKEIARILDAVDAAMDRTRTTMDRAIRLKRGLSQRLLPQWIGFKRVLLESLAKDIIEVVSAANVARIVNGSTPSRENPAYWRAGTVPWLATGKVNEKIIRYADEHVTPKALAECSIELLPIGTVLVGMIGQGKTRGMAAYLNCESCINQNFGAFIPGPRLVGKWLYHYLDFHYTFLREAGGGTNQGALNCYLLKRIRIPILLKEFQQEVADLLDACDEKIASYVHIFEMLERLKRGLMQDLLTGKVRVKLCRPQATAQEQLDLPFASV